MAEHTRGEITLLVQEWRTGRSCTTSIWRWDGSLDLWALGQRDETLDVLRNSPDGVLADVSRWPDVADLYKDSRFSQLLASHQLK